MDRTCGVGGDELEVDAAPRDDVTVSVGFPGLEDLLDDPALRVRGQPDVDETGAGHSRFRDGVAFTESGDEPGGELPRTDPHLLRRLHGDVGGVITVLGVAWSFDGDLFRE